jgi:hypothetical protein
MLTSCGVKDGLPVIWEMEHGALIWNVVGTSLRGSSAGTSRSRRSAGLVPTPQSFWMASHVAAEQRASGG